MLVSPPQNKTWHGGIRKSGEKQQKLRHYLLSINIKKYWIVMITVHRHHIRAEKEEWKTTVEINMLAKMISSMTGRKLNGLIHNCCSWSFIFWIFWQNIPCFSVSAFTVSLFFENTFILTWNSQFTLMPLTQGGLNSEWSWNFSQNFMGEF